MSPEQKSESFLVRMGPTELKMLQELSEHTGLTKADVVRQLVRREHGAVAKTGAFAGDFTQRTVEKIMKPVRDAMRPGRQLKELVEPIKRARIKK